MHYWGPIRDLYGLNLSVVNATVDPTFRFMTLDWDGRIRMDPSSPYAMRRLIGLKDQFDVAFACDTDSDRHGIVTRSSGLLPPNHYLAVCVHYLFANRSGWRKDAAVGKTVVSSSMIDRVSAEARPESCTKFPWDSNGSWTACCTDRSVLAARKAPARPSLPRRRAVDHRQRRPYRGPAFGRNHRARWARSRARSMPIWSANFGAPVYERIDAPANAEQRAALAEFIAQDITVKQLAGEKIQKILTSAPATATRSVVLK